MKPIDKYLARAEKYGLVSPEQHQAIAETQPWPKDDLVVPDEVPAIDIRRLRSALAGMRMPQAVFADLSGISYQWFNHVINERYEPGAYTRYRLGETARKLGLSGVVIESPPGGTREVRRAS